MFFNVNDIGLLILLKTQSANVLPVTVFKVIDMVDKRPSSTTGDSKITVEGLVLDVDDSVLTSHTRKPYFVLPTEMITAVSI